MVFVKISLFGHKKNSSLQGINISFMTVSRTGRGRDAVMALGVDSQPDADLLAKITGLAGITEFALVKED